MHFRKANEKKRFLGIFKEQDFGPKAKMTTYKEEQKETQKPFSRTTFTCVIKGVPINTDINKLIIHLKQKGFTHYRSY